MQIRDIVTTALLLLTPAVLKAQTVRLEAEDAKLEGPNLHAARPAANGQPVAGFSGAGYVTGFADNADRVVFTYTAPKAGIYDLKIGYRSNGHPGYELEVNDLGISGSFPSLSSKEFSTDDAGRIELKAGVNTLAISQGWKNYEIDFIEISPSGPIAPPMPVTTSPVDVQATPEARALLKKLDDTYGHGAFTGADSDADAQYIVDQTGHRPYIMESDLSPYSPASVAHNGGRPNQTTERMIAHAQEGYTVTMCWHWVAPSGLYNRKVPAVDGKKASDQMYYRGFYTDSTSFDVSIAMNDPLSNEHALLLRDIDAIAEQLKKFQAANVPVLWRPLHEGQGKWFWWGAKGPEPFVALWKLMYDRLVNVDGVHNLIWVYTAGNDPAWYPGDAYVDVVGIDAYPKDLRDPQSELWTLLYKDFAGKKPIAVSEFGGVADVERMHRLGNDFVYAVPWNGSEGPKKNTPEELRRIYSEDLALKLPATPAPAISKGGP